MVQGSLPQNCPMSMGSGETYLCEHGTEEIRKNVALAIETN